MTKRGLILIAGTLTFLGAIVGFASKFSTNYDYKERVELGHSAMLGGRTFLDDIDGDSGVDSIIGYSYDNSFDFYDPKKEELLRKTRMNLEHAIPLTSDVLSLANNYFNGNRNVESELKEKLNQLKEKEIK